MDINDYKKRPPKFKNITSKVFPFDKENKFRKNNILLIMKKNILLITKVFPLIKFHNLKKIKILILY